MYTETVTPANETVLPEKPSVKDLDSVLAEIAENTRIQAKNSKKQLIWLRVCAIALALILAIVAAVSIVVVPKTVKLVNDLEALTSQLSEGIEAVTTRLEKLNVESLVDDVDKLIDSLSPAVEGLKPMMENIDRTVTDAHESIGTALEKLQSINLEKLNKAITDLSTIIEPLARLFGK